MSPWSLNTPSPIVLAGIRFPIRSSICSQNRESKRPELFERVRKLRESDRSGRIHIRCSQLWLELRCLSIRGCPSALGSRRATPSLVPRLGMSPYQAQTWCLLVVSRISPRIPLAGPSWASGARFAPSRTCLWCCKGNMCRPRAVRGKSAEARRTPSIKGRG